MNLKALKNPAHFGVVEHMVPNGQASTIIVSKNSRQDGYQTVKLLEEAIRRTAKSLERNGHTVLKCTVVFSPTVIVVDPADSYELKP